MGLLNRVLALTLVLLAAPLAGPAHGGSGPACQPGDVFENEEVRVWFHGGKGFVKVFDANASREGPEGGSGSHYAYTTGEVAELDAEGERLAWMGLERAYPQTGACTLVDSGDALHLTFTVTDDVKSHGGDVGQATVEFAYRFNKTSQGAKFDLRVVDWPWRSEESLLAYAFDVQASGATLEPAENGVGIRGSEGASRGYVEWAPNATATYEDGHQELSLVNATTRVTGGKAAVTLRFTNVTAGYAALDYDPWAGVGEWLVVGGRLVGLAPVQALLPALPRLPPRLL